MAQVDEIKAALLELGGIATYSDLYRRLEEVRGRQLTNSDKASVRKEVERFSSDSALWEKKQDIFFSAQGLGRGVWGLRDLEADSPKANDLDADGELPSGRAAPKRIKSEINRVIRDTQITKILKGLHNGECQLCGSTITLRDGSRYSEAHHVRPLGNPHYGPDTPDNILVVCPNCHVLLDFVAIPLDVSAIRRVARHTLSASHVEYHNRQYSEVTGALGLPAQNKK